MSHVSRLVVSLVVTGLLAACGAQDEPAAQPDRSAPAAAPESRGNPAEPCGLLSGDQVGEQFDISTVNGRSQPTQTAPGNGAKVYACEYLADATGTSLGALSVSVHNGNAIRPERMIASVRAQRQGARDVPELAGPAVLFDDHESKTLATAKMVSGTPVMVMFIASPRATKDMLVALVEDAAGRL